MNVFKIYSPGCHHNVEILINSLFLLLQAEAKEESNEGGKIQKWGGAWGPGTTGEDCFQSIGKERNYLGPGETGNSQGS